MADAEDSKSSAARHGGSSPSTSTNLYMKRTRSKFPKELVKEYGEQTYRDRKSHNAAYRKYANPKTNPHFRKTDNHGSLWTWEDAAWTSVYVANGVGLITDKEQDKFHAAIVNYAKTTKFPRNFI
jgi:hypothetical protein